ncbi:MAG TPA: Spy/CpxP family protein refolding chaperone [Xanthobacteraceae bacterium]|nr:Spy/CpxP family protein refolding chaperone [Xanthobacteraceae bacterium]
MWKAALAGAVALATVGTLSVSQHGVGVAPAAAEEIIVTEGQIARLHAALRLTSTQEHYWHAVAATLRNLAHHQQEYQLASADSGFVARTRARLSGYALTGMAMQRLHAAAQPLIGVLNDEQKEAGRTVLASMGVAF